MVVACLAAAAEGAVIYQQWPSPGPKFCASVELGELLATAARTEADLREARARLQTSPSDAAAQDVMRLESVSAAASNEVANYKRRQQDRMKANGQASRDGSCG